MSKKTRWVYFSVFALFFVAAIPALLLYATGYSLDEALRLTRRGGIFLYVSQTDAQVFIGDELVATTSLFEKEIFVKNLTAKNYLILVSHPDFWPWAKTVRVKEGSVEARFPILVPKILQFRELPKNSANYLAAAQIFSGPISDVVPDLRAGVATTTFSLIKKSGNMEISADETWLRANWRAATSSVPHYFCTDASDILDGKDMSDRKCAKEALIFKAAQKITNVDFYPDRDDVALLSFGNGIYAVELDKTNYHNVYPIFRGQAPDFRVEDRLIYVKDGNFIAVVEI